MWNSIHPGSADGMFAARHAEIERRYAPQVVLEGSGTFAADTDGPITGLPTPSGDIATLYDDFLPAEANCRWFAVVDGRGRIRWRYKGDAGRRLLVIVSHATPAPYLAHLRSEDVPYLVAGDGPVDLGDALRTMRDQLGATCVVSEAGGGLNGALLRSGLVDELHRPASDSTAAVGRTCHDRGHRLVALRDRSSACLRRLTARPGPVQVQRLAGGEAGLLVVLVVLAGAAIRGSG
jgi:2,5-diamino-6-(ribosylamino)-4(3H)-pyrimidinone 5'-phosphate reductase